jgi:hypothetical protein
MISCGALRIASASFCFRLAHEVLADHAARRTRSVTEHRPGRLRSSLSGFFKIATV